VSLRDLKRESIVHTVDARRLLDESKCDEAPFRSLFADDEECADDEDDSCAWLPDGIEFTFEPDCDVSIELRPSVRTDELDDKFLPLVM
jgi:hypothetical protein